MTFARLVHSYTGDWFTEVDCAYIDDEKRGYGDEVVYLGDSMGLAIGDELVFKLLSQHDRYNFDDQHNRFYVNFDPECRKMLNIDPEKNHIAFFNKEAK